MSAYASLLPANWNFFTDRKVEDSAKQKSMRCLLLYTILLARLILSSLDPIIGAGASRGPKRWAIFPMMPYQACSVREE